MKFAVILGGLLLIGAFGAGGYLFLNNGEFPNIFGSSNTREPPKRLSGEASGGTTATMTASQQQAGEAETATADGGDAIVTETPEFVTEAAPVEEDGPLRFIVPVDCKVGRTCVVQNYVDMSPGLDFADYACGSLTYEKHNGTDIRLPSHKEMEAGVDVLAAASGTVEDMRDGMPDVNYRLVGREALTGRDLGNAVTIRHKDGYETNYGHMKRGSVTVKIGDTVTTGQKIGQIGLSGLTEFPHLHFEVRRNDLVIDPFTGTVAETGCNGPAEPMWTDAALQSLKYIPSLVMRIGFSDRILNRTAIEYGLHQTGKPLARTSDTLLLHVYAAGLYTGDIARFQLTDPAGEIFVDAERIIDENAAVQVLRAGAADRTTPWEPGTYTGLFTLSRTKDGETEVVLRAETSVEVE